MGINVYWWVYVHTGGYKCPCLTTFCVCRQRRQVNGLSSGMPPSASTSSDLTLGRTCGVTESHSGRLRPMARSHTR